jgi:hypothetical protein
MSDEGATAPAARRWHVLGFVLLTAIGLYAVVVSLHLGLWRQGSPGEGLFPFMTAVAVTGFSLISLAGAWRSRDVPPPDARGDLRASLLRIAIYVVGLVLYAATLDALGFAVSTIVAVVFILRFAERYAWLPTLALAVGTVAGCWLLFVYWLGAMLPTGSVWDALLYSS